MDLAQCSRYCCKLRIQYIATTTFTQMMVLKNQGYHAPKYHLEKQQSKTPTPCK